MAKILLRVGLEPIVLHCGIVPVSGFEVVGLDLEERPIKTTSYVKVKEQAA